MIWNAFCCCHYSWNQEIKKRKLHTILIDCYIFIAATVFVAGCAGTYHGIPYSSVKIFWTAPNCSYQELGTIAEEDEDYDDLIENLQLRVLELGGNAIIVLKENGAKQGSALVLNGVAGAEYSEKKGIVAMAIKLP